MSENKLVKSLDDIINSKREYDNKYSKLKQALPTKHDIFNKNNLSKIGFRRHDRHYKNRQNFKGNNNSNINNDSRDMRGQRDLSYVDSNYINFKLLKIDNLNHNITNEDLRVAF